MSIAAKSSFTTQKQESHAILDWLHIIITLEIQGH